MSHRLKTPPSISDQDFRLVRLVVKGDRQAFDTLVKIHQQRIFNLCFWMLNDYQDANDTAQEVFFNAYRSIKKFRFKSSFRTWLYRITINTCKNKLQSLSLRMRKLSRSIDCSVLNDNPHGDWTLADPAQTPDKQLESKERLRLVHEAIDKLPPNRRIVVVLRDIEGVSYEDIAALLALNIGTVKSRLARGRLQLAEFLKDML